MTDRLRDIRELMDDTDAYRDELYRRWTGLLSYRYIGRSHDSMNLGESDDTVPASTSRPSRSWDPASFTRAAPWVTAAASSLTPISRTA